ncbi:transmembrane protein 238-like [Eublepharis macularius]|uniref:Transmembrane protein 238-like n=1 Tax=Eublepharis macularius TaxID=481883 RepID=A0AA97JC34_EUBMA|nr:transmembrane protein 238-like [Eublepharis macularius]XP_054834582.1 transmembrane protein 238-like [Eublepharis macularius]
MAPGWCGRCTLFLVAALVLDAAGLALVLAGAVGKPTLAGSSFEDFLVLSGALLLFLSLLCWLFWYSGNLRGVPPEELPLGARPRTPAPRGRGSLVRLAAKLSERLSQRRRLAPAPSLPPDPGLSARVVRSAAAAAAASSPRPSGPLELSHLRPAAHPEQGTPEERLV